MNRLVFLLGMLFCVSTYGQHYQSFSSSKKLHNFFSYSKNKFLVSGHRGTSEKGFPENSIEAMQEVLKHNWAFFEIDPRVTKDSVVILMHDATLERTTNGSGKVADYTWEELQKLNLKDKDGNLTPYKIPTLEAAILWAKGKTVLNLDQKDVPIEVSARIIKDLKAYNHVMVTVHSPKQAAYYLAQNPNQMLSVHVQTPEKLNAYEEAKIPLHTSIAYIGSNFKPENQELLERLNAKGVMCMMAAGPIFDKIENKEERYTTYKKVKTSGASILESDLPIELAASLKK